MLFIYYMLVMRTVFVTVQKALFIRILLDLQFQC